MKRLGTAFAVLFLFIACDTTPTGFELPPPSRAVVDGAHGGGNEHFFWLTPMVRPAPSFGGIFDGSRSPVVDVCEWDGSSCVQTILTLDLSSGLTVDPVGEKYKGEWVVSDYNPEAGDEFRVTVTESGQGFGLADVMVVETQGFGKIKNQLSGEYIVLKEKANGKKALDIKFRIEEGAVRTPGIWTMLQPLPAARRSGAGGVINGKLYVTAGCGSAGFNCGPTASTEVYDPVTDQWSTVASIPTPRTGAGAGVIDGILYVVSGIRFPLNCPSVTQILEGYDPANNAWVTFSPIGRARLEPATVVLGGLLYVLGGRNCIPPYEVERSGEVYNPATDSWAYVDDMPQRRYGAVAGVIDGKIYVAGGYDTSTSTFLSRLDIYDPATDSWTTGASLPVSLRWAQGGVVNGKLYFVGGRNSSDVVVATVFEYDPVFDDWFQVADVPQPTTVAVTGVINNELYLAGGLDNSVNLSSLVKFTPPSGG